MFSSSETRRMMWGWVGIIAILLTILPGMRLTAAEQPETGFPDVPPSASHATDVTALATQGVFEGTLCGDGRFCPSDPLPRWVMAVWLTRVLNNNEPPPTSTSRFVDVTNAAWWAPHTEHLYQLGVTKGCQTDPPAYCPEANVTRAQMASFLVRAFGYQWDGIAGFTDTTGNTHAQDIDILWGVGITKGCAIQPARYCPDQNVTRAQMAGFLNRARTGGLHTSTESDPSIDGGGGGGGGGSSSGGGGSSSSGGGGGAVARPTAPLDLRVLEGDEQLTVMWAPPAGNGRTKVTGYVVEHKPNSASNWTKHETTAFSITIRNLRNGILYQVRVSARNSGGLGAAANGNGTPAATAPAVPGAPQNLTISSGDSKLFLSWDQPSQNGGSDITGYLVEYRADQDLSWTEHGYKQTTQTLISNLINGATYHIRVSAVNANDQGASAILTATPGKSDPPRYAQVLSRNQQLIVSWIPPALNGGSHITEYEIEYTDPNDGAWITATRSVSSPSTITGLDNGALYRVRVRAINAAGLGPPSHPASGRPGAPSAPRNVVLEVTRNDSAPTSFDGGLNVHWAAPLERGPITRYLVQWRKADSEDFDSTTRQVEVRNLPTSGSPYLLLGLDYGTEYSVRVIAVNANGIGPPSGEVQKTPLSSGDQLGIYIEDSIVEVHQETHPWLRLAFDNMMTLRKPFEIRDIPSAGRAITGCDDTDTLKSCTVFAIWMDPLYYRYNPGIVHELGHAYTLATWPDTPPAVGVGWLYMSSLSAGDCQDSELYADTFSAVLFPDYSPAVYWARCNRRSRRSARGHYRSYDSSGSQRNPGLVRNYLSCRRRRLDLRGFGTGMA